MVVRGFKPNRSANASDRTSSVANASPAPSAARPGPIPSLDGLRAVAVLIVVASHAGYGNTIPGGLGVTIFFFLSGYLITTLMLDESARHGRVNIKNFYFRRAFRLLPPLVVTLAIAYGLVAFDLLGGGVSWAGLASQLFYFANYFQVFHATPETQPDGTGILWSLAVEEHFYIVFPVVVFAAFRLRHPRPVLVALIATLCVAALAWRVWLVSNDVSELRTYYATDTRFDSILYGCALALCANPARLPVHRLRPTMRMADWALLALGCAVMLSTLLYREADFRESLRYTLQGIALLPIFYYAIRYPRALPFRVLSLRLVAWIGVLSYGIYLIHVIVLATVAHNIDAEIPPPVRLAIALAGSIAFATLVDRYVDPYFRRRRAALHWSSPGGRRLR